jgi:hypothetical protein
VEEEEAQKHLTFLREVLAVVDKAETLAQLAEHQTLAVEVVVGNVVETLLVEEGQE